MFIKRFICLYRTVDIHWGCQPLSTNPPDGGERERRFGRRRSQSNPYLPICRLLELRAEHLSAYHQV